MSKVINGFTVAALTAVQAAIINQARASAPDKRDPKAGERKDIKREIYANAKAKYGIPPDVKVMAFTSNPDNPEYLVLHAAGKRNPLRGQAFKLGDDGKWDGTYLAKDQLFPPPVVVVQETPATAGGVGAGQPWAFGGAAGKWFRLDPAQVALALTATDLSDIYNDGDLVDHVTTEGDGIDTLPVQHLMLAGRDDLAIVADGSIYRKQ